MTNEIKEIIKLGCEEEIEVKYFAKDNSLVNTYMDYSQLLDYITNLQEEIKEADEAVEYWQEQYGNLQQRIDKVFEKLDDDYILKNGLSTKKLRDILRGEE